MSLAIYAHYLSIVLAVGLAVASLALIENRGSLRRLAVSHGLVALAALPPLWFMLRPLDHTPGGGLTQPTSWVEPTPWWAWFRTWVNFTVRGQRYLDPWFVVAGLVVGLAGLIQGLRVDGFGRIVARVRTRLIGLLKRRRGVVVKGCASDLVPSSAYLIATQKLQQHARKLMYGEPCSSVPLWRRPKDDASTPNADAVGVKKPDLPSPNS